MLRRINKTIRYLYYIYINSKQTEILTPREKEKRPRTSVIYIHIFRERKYDI